MNLSSTRTLALACALALSACSSPATRSGATARDFLPAKGIIARPLTHEEAQTRFKQVAHVTYGLWFGLDEHNDDYEGRASINFDLKPKARDHAKDLFIDFYDGTIHSIILNGNTLANPTEHYDGNRIHFEVSELQPGANRIEIAFLHKYSSNGHGLYRFKDPEDGKIYLYSDNEPFFAHQMFPCFDQPDLKAAYELTVAAPEDWGVVSNTLERDVNVVDGKKVWVFPPTPLLSSYLFALIAGDYAMWKADAQGIPLRLFARKALKSYVDAAEWFDTTRKGLEFYAVQFGYPYPYSKYDQILVPDFDEGAMENAGAVTFSEKFIYRTRVPQRTHLHRANVILHEMAHMWFGDLVTMKWWNGLWLNESFADFMAAWSADSATSFKGSWQDFFSEDKGWAYWQDQLATTHPIELPVVDTDHAFSNFDGITYGKGASVIKQLRFFLGEDDFKEGLQRYFQKYALRNSTLAEFMKKLSEASGKDLTHWQELWLTTPGINTVQADWACGEDGKISKFALLQGNAPESTTLRTHSSQVALFYKSSGGFVTKDPASVNYSKDRTGVPELVGKACPEFVYPNYNDQDYIQVQLDPISLQHMQTDLKNIPDPMVRQMVWSALYDSVVAGRLPATEYLTTAIANLAPERDAHVLLQVLDSLVELNSGRDSVLKFIEPPRREPLFSKYEELCLGQLKRAAPVSDLQLVWLDAFLDSVHTPKGLDFTRKLLTKKLKLSGVKIDQEVRWSLVTALARAGAPDAKDLIAAERKTDPSRFGKSNELKALAEIPNAADKLAWFEKIQAAGRNGGSTPELSSSDVATVMRGLPMLGQETLTDQWLPRYFEYLPEAVQSPNEEFMSMYTRALFPAVCSPRVIEPTQKSLSSSLAAEAEKSLKTHLQEEQRCLKIRGGKKEP